MGGVLQCYAGLTSLKFSAELSSAPVQEDTCLCIGSVNKLILQQKRALCISVSLKKCSCKTHCWNANRLLALIWIFSSWVGVSVQPAHPAHLVYLQSQPRSKFGTWICKKHYFLLWLWLFKSSPSGTPGPIIPSSHPVQTQFCTIAGFARNSLPCSDDDISNLEPPVHPVYQVHPVHPSHLLNPAAGSVWHSLQETVFPALMMTFPI